MTCQATALRALAGCEPVLASRDTRVYAAAGGKGGVGKSAIVATPEPRVDPRCLRAHQNPRGQAVPQG